MFQVLVADFSILAMMAFYTANMPMKDGLNNFVQIFNELAVLLLLQCMFLLTDFIENPVDRHDYGYWFLYYVAVLIVLNLIVLVYSLVMDARHYIRKSFY